MKISGRWDLISMAGKIMMCLVLAAVIGSVSAAPAFSDDRRHDRRYDHNRGHDNRGYDRNRHYYRPHGYREPVYSPIYMPPPAPGISIFFPFPR